MKLTRSGLCNQLEPASGKRSTRDQNPDTDGNIRDHSTIEQLVVLANLEGINAMLIQQGMSQPERLRQLNALAIQQMKSLLQSPSNKNLLD